MAANATLHYVPLGRIATRSVIIANIIPRALLRKQWARSSLSDSSERRKFAGNRIEIADSREIVKRINFISPLIILGRRKKRARNASDRARGQSTSESRSLARNVLAAARNFPSSRPTSHDRTSKSKLNEFNEHRRITACV